MFNLILNYIQIYIKSYFDIFGCGNCEMNINVMKMENTQVKMRIKTLTKIQSNAQVKTLVKID